MKCLLVYPHMPDTFYALKHFARITGKKAAFPPLGLMTVAGLLPTSWDLKLVDINVEPLTDQQLAWADLVFLSAMNVQEESVRDILNMCDRHKAKVIAGGPLFTHEYERFPTIDYLVLNEAEITLPRFLADFEKGEARRIYKSPEFADVTTTPLPLYNLIDMSNYMYAILQYSRGCPYLCDFCDVTALFGRKPRTKTVEQVLTELELIRKHSNVNTILIADDNLIGNKRLLKKELLPAIIDWQKKQKYGFYFATQLTINLADDEELMDLLAEAGFRFVFIGIETPEEAGLKVSHKTQNLKRDLLETIHRIHKRGFTIFGGFIVGFDTDTQASFTLLRDFIQESGIPMPIVNVLKAPPGTELFERMKRENRLIKDFAFEEGDTNIRPIMDGTELIRGFLEVVDGVYTPENSYNRFKTYIENMQYTGSKTKIRTQIGWTEVIIGLRTIFYLGVQNKNRKYFWKMLYLIKVKHRKSADLALVLSLFSVQMDFSAQHLREQSVKNIEELQQNERVLASA